MRHSTSQIPAGVLHATCWDFSQVQGVSPALTLEPLVVYFTMLLTVIVVAAPHTPSRHLLHQMIAQIPWHRCASTLLALRRLAERNYHARRSTRFLMGQRVVKSCTVLHGAAPRKCHCHTNLVYIILFSSYQGTNMTNPGPAIAHRKYF